MWWLSQEGQSWKSLPQQVPCTWEMIAYLIAAALREDHTSLFYPCRLVFPQFSQALIIFHFIIQPQHPNRAIQGGFIFWFQLHAVDHMLPCGVRGQHWCLGTSKKTKKNHTCERKKKSRGVVFLWHIDGTHGQTTELNWQTATAHVFLNSPALAAYRHQYHLTH